MRRNFCNAHAIPATSVTGHSGKMEWRICNADNATARYDAHVSRHPMNAHVQETSDDAAQREKYQRPEWNGSTSQLCGLKIASMPNKHFLPKRDAFPLPARACPSKSQTPSRPDAATCQSVRRFDSGSFGRSDQCRFCRTINHVVNRARLFQRNFLFIQRRCVACLQAQRSRIDHQINRGFRITDRDLRGGKLLFDFGGDFLRLILRAIEEK